MLTLITGVPGSAKTLLAVSYIEKQVLINRDPKTKPEDIRPIFSDIDGIDFGDDVIVVDKDHDWRTTPDGSMIFYDEAHKRWPSTGKTGRSDDETCRDLDEHRHTGHDLFAITQWPTKIHHELRTNVNRHFHVVRTMGAELATIYEWNQAQSSPDRRDIKDSADSRSFRYPKRLYKHYKSATIHTHKFKFPTKMKVVLVAIFGLSGITVYAASVMVSGGEPKSFNTENTQIATNPLNPIIDKTKGVFKTQLIGCISNDTDCHCYTADGEVLEQDFLECKLMESKPLPFPHDIKTNS